MLVIGILTGCLCIVSLFHQTQSIFCLSAKHTKEPPMGISNVDFLARPAWVDPRLWVLLHVKVPVAARVSQFAHLHVLCLTQTLLASTWRSQLSCAAACEARQCARRPVLPICMCPASHQTLLASIQRSEPLCAAASEASHCCSPVTLHILA